MAIPPGQRLGSYEVLSALGAGGMGEVYRARDIKLGRDVAIKVLPEEFAHDPERLSRFQREAKTVAALNHPNIAAIYGLEEDHGRNYLVMELVPGETLQARIAREGAIPVEEALRIARQIAEALEAAHDKGIIHRDLKPANVNVTPEGKVKVLDFGLAKAFAGEESGSDPSNSPTLSHAATVQGVILGTAAYMSPEQARGKKVDKRTDIWSFGVVLYEMLTGQRLFKGETVSDTLAAVLRHEPDWSKVPTRVRRLVRTCLEKDPNKRLRDIADGMLLLEESPVAESPDKNATAVPRWVWGIGALACLITAGLAWVFFHQKPRAVPQTVRFQIRLPEKVTFSAGGNFTMSPDGQHIAFSAFDPNGRPGVWIQDLDAVEARPLPDAATGPDPPPFFWSPDSRFVVYSRSSPKLSKVDVTSGESQDICDKPNPPVGGSWNRDGVIIFGSNVSGLWRVPAAGGTPVPLTVLDTSRHEREHELPSFLPDGKHFLYLIVSSVQDNTGIFVGTLNDPPERQSRKRLLATGFGAQYVPSPDGGSGHLLFLRDGNLMSQTFAPDNLELIGDPSLLVERLGTTFESGFFSASPDTLVYRTSSSLRDFQLTWFDVQGRRGEAVGDPAYIVTPQLSPDGTRVAYAVSAPSAPQQRDLWLLDLARGVSTRFTFDRSSNLEPVWSPDGSEIVFASNRQGVYNIYEKPSNGAKEEELLLRSNEDERPLSWSRDGRFLLYASSQSYNFSTEDLWVLPMQGDRTPFLFAQTGFDESDAQFSPDGRWVLYTSNESGPYEVYVREFSGSPASAETGAKWQISKGGGAYAMWRADGKEIAYLSADRTSLWSVSVDTSHSFQAGVPALMFQVPGTRIYGGSVAPASDLKRFLVTVPVEEKTPQTFSVIVNWTAGLKN